MPGGTEPGSRKLRPEGAGQVRGKDDLAIVAGFDPTFVALEPHGTGAGGGMVLWFAVPEGRGQEVAHQFDAVGVLGDNRIGRGLVLDRRGVVGLVGPLA